MSGKCDVIVIGAGASGMTAAIAAKNAGANVTVVERNSTAGRKIAATGNGRCNFTNADADDIAHYYSQNKAFVEGVLKRFTVTDMLELFDMLGATPNLEEDGKYFPLSGQASSVAELFERFLKKNGIDVLYGTKIKDIDLTNEKLKLITDSGDMWADRVIIATGGMACPDSGSDGNGYALAQKAGHKLTHIMPVIVQVKTKGGFYKRINGLRINASVGLEVDGKIIQKETGDVMFFDYGLSGSAIFKLSCKASYALDAGKSVFAVIDFVPQFETDALKKYIAHRCTVQDCSTGDMLVGFVNKKLIQLIVDESGIDIAKRADKLSEKEIASLCHVLKGLKAPITGTKGWENAQATAGGIELSDVDGKTLRSRLDERIGFCGEILDVVGDCGGYNLSWAWASGFVCGSNIVCQ